MRIVHLSPTYFAPESLLGGGERFVDAYRRIGAQPVKERVYAAV